MQFIDLFAGAGGFSLGFHKADFKGVFAIEKSLDAFETYHHNLIKKYHYDWPLWLDIKNHDITDVLLKHKNYLKNIKNEVSVVIGGPPCQGFSFAGKRNYEDKRNNLIFYYLEFIKIINPSIIVFENVPGIMSCFKETKINYGEKIIEELKSLKYYINWQIIDFSNFGIPQKRKRFILVGSKIKNVKEFFNVLNEEKKTFLREKKLPINRPISSEEAISDLLKSHGIYYREKFYYGMYGSIKSSYQLLMRKDIANNNIKPDSHRFANHKRKTIEKFKQYIQIGIKNNTIKKKIINVLDPQEASPTLTTLPDDLIHYQEPRILTVREYARLQSFPDNFEFKGKYTTGGNRRKEEVPRYTQVGNAVPPLFAELCANTIKKYFNL